MTFEDVAREIESARLATEVNLASSLGVAVAICQSNEAFARLEELWQSDKRLGATVLKRVMSLCQQMPDVRYEHHADIAILTYLLALKSFDRDLAFSAAAEIRRVANLWWALRLANEVLQHPLGANKNAGRIQTAFYGGASADLLGWWGQLSSITHYSTASNAIYVTGMTTESAIYRFIGSNATIAGAVLVSTTYPEQPMNASHAYGRIEIRSEAANTNFQVAA